MIHIYPTICPRAKSILIITVAFLSKMMSPLNGLFVCLLALNGHYGLLKYYDIIGMGQGRICTAVQVFNLDHKGIISGIVQSHYLPPPLHCGISAPHTRRPHSTAGRRQLTHSPGAAT